MHSIQISPAMWERARREGEVAGCGPATHLRNILEEHFLGDAALTLPEGVLRTVVVSALSVPERRAAYNLICSPFDPEFSMAYEWAVSAHEGEAELLAVLGDKVARGLTDPRAFVIRRYREHREQAAEAATARSVSGSVLDIG